MSNQVLVYSDYYGNLDVYRWDTEQERINVAFKVLSRLNLMGSLGEYAVRQPDNYEKLLLLLDTREEDLVGFLWKIMDFLGHRELLRVSTHKVQ